MQIFAITKFLRRKLISTKGITFQPGLFTYMYSYISTANNCQPEIHIKMAGLQLLMYFSNSNLV